VAPQPSILATSHVADHPLRENGIIEEPSRASAPPSQASASDEGATAGRKTPTYENYLFPPLSLLNRSVPISNINSQAEIDETSARLVNEFRKFKFAIEVREVTIGPRITRYCISPPDGVRINTLIGLANDIALGLAVKSIRINPVPDTPYLGVEIPNRNPSTVRLSSLVDTEEFRHTKTVTTVPLGANITGSPVFADIAKMPHVLVAGATGMGKSVLINSILLSLLYKSKPNEVKLILVDPKRVEMSVYNGIPHLLIPPVVEPQKAAGALIWAVGEMERRYHLMETMGTRSIEGYNEAVKRDPSRGEPQPKIIIVIDELNDLMMQARDAVEPAIMSIAQKARAAGIHLIIGTQRPSVDVITGVIKANIPSRIALHVSSGTDSRTILDTYGAEKLLDKGDMLAVISGAEPIRVQSAFVSDEEVENVTSFLRQNAGPAVYDEIISAQIDSETEKYKNSGKRASDRGDDDEEMDGSIFEDSQFMQACNVALESGKISTSLLQRRCSIGYGKAAKYIDVMESMGIVSAPDGQKPRDVLMSRDQFMEMVSRENFSGD
jgi:S-DNA-T family DNA segregation ATPase FtsK/SpoIIIE